MLCVPMVYWQNSTVSRWFQDGAVDVEEGLL
jgi:hypothetical protein